MTWLPADAVLADDEDWDAAPDLHDLLEEPAPKRQYPFPEWHEDALCNDMPEESFFGSRDTNERPAISMSVISRAKAVCAECPVYETCLRTALGLEGENREEYGIWAGTSGRTRKRIWHLVDEDGASLEEIAIDILEGSLAKYEHDTDLRPLATSVIPFPRGAWDDYEEEEEAA